MNPSCFSITPENFLKHEFIGLDCSVYSSNDPNKEGIEGRVVWETKNMLYIEDDGETKKLLKNESVFEFSLSSNDIVRIKGELINKQPEDRVKEKVLNIN